VSEDRRHNRDHEISRPLVELVSAYLDDRDSLSGRELEHVERLLEQNQDARRIHAELRAITGGLANLGPVPAPRSYHLDAEMVGAPELVVMQETTAWYVRHTQKVRWATAAAAILFVFVLGADLALNGLVSDSNGDQDHFQTDQSEMTGREAGDFDEDAGDDGAAVAEDDAGDEAGEGEEAPSTLLVPDTSGDSDEAESDMDSDTSDEAIPTEALEESAEESEAEPDTGGGTDAIPGDSDEDRPADDSDSEPPDEPAADVVTPDAAGPTEQSLAFEQDVAAETDDGGSDRRLWRIAQFSLAVLLGLLITALVVLPRLGGAASRTRGGQ